jgi:hypothetical protein
LSSSQAEHCCFCFFVRHRFPQLDEGTHNGVTVFAFGFIGFMFAILVTFVSNSLWGQINDADAKARTEGATGLQLAGDLTAFDKADSDRIRQSLLEYERAAIVEWPEAASGRSFPEAESSPRNPSRQGQWLCGQLGDWPSRRNWPSWLDKQSGIFGG